MNPTISFFTIQNSETDPVRDCTRSETKTLAKGHETQPEASHVIPQVQTLFAKANKKLDLNFIIAGVLSCFA